MAVVAGKALVREAKLTQCERSLSGGCAAVGITPDAIELVIRISLCRILK